MARFDLVAMAAAVAMSLGTAGWAGEPPAQEEEVAQEDSERVVRTDAEWKQLLSAEEYDVLRQCGTERAFTGKYWKTKTPGVYHCAGCGAPLFSSEAKYDSGSGWPSYFQPVSEDAILTKVDRKLYVPRTEILCARCGGHLGHVFPDGPPPTGQRYCVNSAALELKPSE